ncbi:PREDICTED: pickpocket protein 28-like [Nicrophorus vespilloides]|uniref:Pickpocket protein 28-like n=1 Tax=Nicrophorus vespilloides TaxID=110193 RepID=A0ABM1N5T1_NICVS|nr:PREDICTED: pickpocket protein 28-like [Nicrophorus vespilloides]
MAHGFVQVVRRDRTPFERFFWILVIVAACVPCILFAGVAWTHFWHHPTVITLERDHWNWVTAFPSITACPVSFKMDTLAEIAENKTVPTAKLELFSEFLQDLFYGNYSTYGNLEKYKEDFDDIPPEMYIDLNYQLCYLGDTEQEFISFDRNMTKIMTEYGFCYNYNSEIAPYFSYEYWKHNHLHKLPTARIDYITPALESPMFKLNSIDANVMFFMHGKNELIDLMSKRFLVEGMKFTVLEVNSQSTWSPKSMRNLHISQRHCRFIDESNLKYSPVYSTKLCKIECRIEMALRLCKCLPFYYRNLHGSKICGIDGMMCLSQHDDQMIRLRDGDGNNLCQCEPNCNEDIVTVLAGDSKDWIFGCVAQIIYIFNIPVRYRRSIIYSLTDLLVQIGGITGLCFGLSVLSVMEVIYFLTLRFYWAVIRDRS